MTTSLCLVSLLGPSLYDMVVKANKKNKNVLVERIPELADIGDDNVAIKGIDLTRIPDRTLVKQEFFMASELHQHGQRASIMCLKKLAPNYINVHSTLIQQSGGILNTSLKESHHLQIVPFGIDFQ